MVSSQCTDRVDSQQLSDVLQRKKEFDRDNGTNTLPSIPLQKVVTDIFDWKGSQYHLVVD